MYLLDTNILSEILRRQPDAQVMARLFARRSSDLFASEITCFELRRGACLRPDADSFWGRISKDVLPVVSWLPVTQAISERGGEISAELRRLGREAGTLDPLLAATASVHGLTLVTRNFRHFESIHDVHLENWFSEH